jgi:uncharacterized membrane protein YhiD involved in acid resistance
MWCTNARGLSVDFGHLELGFSKLAVLIVLVFITDQNYSYIVEVCVVKEEVLYSCQYVFASYFVFVWVCVRVHAHTHTCSCMYVSACR